MFKICSSFLSTCFFGGMITNDNLDIYTIARENVFHLCKSADFIIYRSRPASVWFVTIEGKLLKVVRCPGDSQIHRWFASRWNRTAAVFCCDFSIKLSVTWWCAGYQWRHCLWPSSNHSAVCLVKDWRRKCEKENI